MAGAAGGVERTVVEGGEASHHGAARQLQVGEAPRGAVLGAWKEPIGVELHPRLEVVDRGVEERLGGAQQLGGQARGRRGRGAASRAAQASPSPPTSADAGSCTGEAQPGVVAGIHQLHRRQLHAGRGRGHQGTGSARPSRRACRPCGPPPRGVGAEAVDHEDLCRPSSTAPRRRGGPPGRCRPGRGGAVHPAPGRCAARRRSGPAAIRPAASAEPASSSTEPPSTTLDRSGAAPSLLPICSNTAPGPCSRNRAAGASGKGIALQPRFTISCHRAGSKPSALPSSRSRRWALTGLRAARNSLAVSASRRCSSNKPDSRPPPPHFALFAFGQLEHPLGDDVQLHLGRTAGDGLGEAAQPGLAQGQLRVGEFVPSQPRARWPIRSGGSQLVLLLLPVHQLRSRHQAGHVLAGAHLPRPCAAR